MAVKKKRPNPPRARAARSPRRSRPARLSPAKPLEAATPQPAWSTEAPSHSKAPVAVVLVLILSLGFGLSRMKKAAPAPESPATAPSAVVTAPPARKTIDKKAPVKAPIAPTATASLPTQKRATSSTGPYVWDRAKTKALPQFKVVRPKDGVAEASLFKAGNKPVRSLKSEAGPHGTVSLVWDGKDNAGHDVAPGIYYVRLSGENSESVEEIRVK